MNLHDNKKWLALTAMMLVVSVGYLSAQAPPPPSVPIDSGVSLLVAAAVAYAAAKRKNKIEE